MMSLAEFLEYSESYNIIPISEEIAGDTLTPITIYKQLCLEDDYTYLLESSEDGRFSFLGICPELVIKQHDDYLELNHYDKNGMLEKSDIINEQLIDYMNEYIRDYNVLEVEGYPPFSGGFVGYFGYEMISKWETLYHDNPEKKMQYSNLPLSTLVYCSVIISIDHKTHTIKVISNAEIDKGLNVTDKEKLYDKHKTIIQEVIKKINSLQYNNFPTNVNNINIGEEFSSNTSKSDFKEMVEEAKNYINEGDAFQIVLSQKFSMETNIPPFVLYRALRMINPSPYLFYLNFPEIKMIGSSPEVLVKVNNKKVITKPLAGTRPRGRTKKEDMALRDELLADEKEKAEHIMLVDLGRNDLGRICKVGSVKVTELMGIELFSRVMHIVSEVEGELDEKYTSLDALKSVFPAGTVSGAPKIRAMEIIDELEKEPRGVYAGAVGYIDLRGNLDTCITIRTIYQLDDKIYIQVGAGIVADSNPEKEYEETLNKARALFHSLKIIREDGTYDLTYR
ncbi:MAG: anthranilate synthase component I [Bacillota bacterium]